MLQGTRVNTSRGHPELTVAEKGDESGRGKPGRTSKCPEQTAEGDLTCTKHTLTHRLEKNTPDHQHCFSRVVRYLPVFSHFSSTVKNLESSMPIWSPALPLYGLDNYCHLSVSGSGSKESACHAEDIRVSGSVPELGRSLGRGNGYPLQFSCLENSMDRGACQATDHGVTKSRTRLSD